MSSILTNNSAMVALQTLQSINKDLSMTQSEISTGKTVGSARDNSAIWAISQTMQSDVSGFGAISEALSLGGSTVAVARNGAESITGLLTEMKEKVVAAQEANDDDRTKIQTDITALRDQVNAITNAAQFNGVNLLQGTESYDVLSSLDRDTAGNVTASQISVARQDLGTTAGALGTDAVGSAGDLLTGTNTGSALAGNAAASSVLTITDAGVADGASYSVTVTGAGSADIGTTPIVATYIATGTDTAADVVTALSTQISDAFTAAGASTTTVAGDTGAGTITIALDGSAGAGDTVQVDIAETLGGTQDGGLLALGTLDVTTDEGATQALADIETLIQTSIDAAAEFGSVEGRIDIQSEFIGNLSDSLKSGIGALVDANMEEASARLQALQVQQQLGIQSLSIANQAPQNILSLFR